MWAWLVARLAIRSVLDVGCGEGHSAKAFQQLGCIVVGLEGCKEAIQNGVIDEIVYHDFVYGACELGDFDLAWCCEVVEHIEEVHLPGLMQTLASSRYIAMTHGVPGQPGHHHVNLQPASYWIAKFAACGYHVEASLTAKARSLATEIKSDSMFRKTGLILASETCLNVEEVNSRSGKD